MYPCAPARPPKDVGRKSLRALRFVESHSPRRARRTRRFGFYRVFSVISVISVISVVDFHPYRWVAGPCNTQDDIFKFMDKSRSAAHNLRRGDTFGGVARIYHQL